MKNFKVIKTSEMEFHGKVFSSRTEIRKYVDLPFTDKQYRCFSFDGWRIKLVRGDKYILGVLN